MITNYQDISTWITSEDLVESSVDEELFRFSGFCIFSFILHGVILPYSYFHGPIHQLVNSQS